MVHISMGVTGGGWSEKEKRLKPFSRDRLGAAQKDVKVAENVVF